MILLFAQAPVLELGLNEALNLCQVYFKAAGAAGRWGCDKKLTGHDRDREHPVRPESSAGPCVKERAPRKLTAAHTGHTNPCEQRKPTRKNDNPTILLQRQTSFSHRVRKSTTCRGRLDLGLVNPIKENYTVLDFFPWDSGDSRPPH